MSVYGNDIDKCNNEKRRLNPETGYAMTKYAQENIFNIYSRVNNIKFLCLRFGYIYSKNINSKRFIKKIIKKISKNNDLKIINGNKINLNLIHTKDISIIIQKIMKDKQGFYNLSSNQFISINSFINKVLNYFPNYKGKITYVDEVKKIKDNIISNDKINAIKSINSIQRLDDTIIEIINEL